MNQIIIQIRPGNRGSHGTTIFETSATPEQLRMRLKILLKAPASSGAKGREKLGKAIDIAVRKTSSGECVFVNLSALFNNRPILTDGFGKDYPLWIPGRGWDYTAIQAGRDNPQQFLA